MQIFYVPTGPTHNFMKLAWVTRTFSIFTSHTLFYIDLILKVFGSIITRLVILATSSLIIPLILLLGTTMLEMISMKNCGLLVFTLLAVKLSLVYGWLSKINLIILLHVIHILVKKQSELDQQGEVSMSEFLLARVGLL